MQHRRIPVVRAAFSLLVAAALAVLPARVGAVASFAGSDSEMAAMIDCPSMGHAASQSDPETAPTSDEHGQSRDHKAALPGACSTYCSSLPALPTMPSIVVQSVIVDVLPVAVGTIRDGIGIAPEPHPPKMI
jgi:hypothetical protein